MDGFGTITWWGFTPSLDLQDKGILPLFQVPAGFLPVDYPSNRLFIDVTPIFAQCVFHVFPCIRPIIVTYQLSSTVLFHHKPIITTPKIFWKVLYWLHLFYLIYRYLILLARVSNKI